MHKDNILKGVISLGVLSVLLAFISLGVSQPGHVTSTKTSAYLPSPTPTSSNQLIITPSRITRNDGYTANIKFNGSDYSGALDYDLSKCNPDTLNCSNAKGPWKANNQDLLADKGVVIVPKNLNLPEGFYLVRFKPRGLADIETNYTNFDTQLVLSRPEPSVSYSSTAINTPPLGSYMLFRDYDSSGNSVGFTRIDIETDPCELGGFTMRFTKSTVASYWNALNDNQLRWCIANQNINGLSTLQALGGTTYGPTLNNISVSYSGTETSPGLLGAIGQNPFLDRYYHDLDQSPHYNLLPSGNRLPQALSSSPITILEEIYGHPIHYYGPNHTNSDQGYDVWHMEAFLPDPSVFALFSDKTGVRMRYNEFAVKSRTQLGWNTQEDWSWNKNGLVSEIKSWPDPVRRCWYPAYVCPSYSAPAFRRLQLIDWYIPNNYPLLLKLNAVDTNSNEIGSEMGVLSIKWNSKYAMKVYKTNDGIKYTPYSGFIEMTPDNGTTKYPWSDTDHKPIYVHQGIVIVGSQAYGNLGKSSPWTGTFRARPYLTNSSLNSVKFIQLLPNTSAAAFSVPITLTISP